MERPGIAETVAGAAMVLLFYGLLLWMIAAY